METNINIHNITVNKIIKKLTDSIGKTVINEWISNTMQIDELPVGNFLVYTYKRLPCTERVHSNETNET